MKTVKIDSKKILGIIKDLNGVGGGPLTANFTCDATELFKEARIPFSRTHDIEYPYGAGEFVDIHCVFPNFKADVDDPESYNFIFTDAYLQAILKAGAKPFYRLGATIEHQPIKRYIFPPADNEKWGKICSHIIAHYNEGWANGFNMGIEYWEIWNEPDLKNRCWTGTEEEFFRLYDTASRIIKADHPDIKLGGCGFTDPRSEMVEHFLAYISKTGASIDFLSWHGYISSPKQAKKLSEYADNLMQKYGYGDIESIYDEWNYVYTWKTGLIQKSIDLHTSALCAAFVSSVMTVLQKGRTDKSMYYDVQLNMKNWNGVFRKGEMTTHGEPYVITPEKPYYALKSWGMLKDLGNEVYCESDDDDVFVVAASDNKTLRVLITYYNDDEGLGRSAPAKDSIKIDLGGLSYKNAEVRIVDDDRDFEPQPLESDTLTLNGNTFALVTFEL